MSPDPDIASWLVSKEQAD